VSRPQPAAQDARGNEALPVARQFLDNLDHDLIGYGPVEARSWPSISGTRTPWLP
jgi:hypothetical protein